MAEMQRYEENLARNTKRRKTGKDDPRGQVKTGYTGERQDFQNKIGSTQ